MSPEEGFEREGGQGRRTGIGRSLHGWGAPWKGAQRWEQDSETGTGDEEAGSIGEPNK